MLTFSKQSKKACPKKHFLGHAKHMFRGGTWVYCETWKNTLSHVIAGCVRDCNFTPK